MHKTRPAACAGSFYPKNPEALAAAIDAMLAQTAGPDLPRPRALIAPHAGYVYSGQVAAQAYSPLARCDFSRVILVGPAHRVYFRGIALPESTAFETPMGCVPVDFPAKLASLPQILRSDEAHALEHALEVQLPFLQAVFERFSIVPLLVGAAAPDAVSEVIDLFLDEPETLVVVSSDLSHFHPYHEAQKLDEATVRAISNLDATLDHEAACGATPINALLLCAKKRGLKPTLLDMKNSGDTAGDRKRVVGYASFFFGENP
ncbi:MAG: AmmeMemoRadiSam system protein B [Burkholderiales bacterium]|nr:AmmeMemoRadiSam system protein B [Burkholderiales bacterium]